MKTLFFKILLLFGVLISGLEVQAQGSIGVAPFKIKGPPEWAYLSSAAQDAIVGALTQVGRSAHALKQNLEPDELKSVKQGKGADALVVSGRISVVGQSFRIVLRWVDAVEKVQTRYLQAEGANNLLPVLESFAKENLHVMTAQETAQVLAAAKAALASPLPAPVATPLSVPSSAPVIDKQEKPVPEKQVSKKEIREASTLLFGSESGPVSDFAGRSQILDYEIRSMTQGDLDQDGTEEWLITGDRSLNIYRYQGGQLQLIGQYLGKPLDTFVKVDVLPATDGQKAKILLTNLRGDRAASKIFEWQNGALLPILEDIPMQLRSVKKGEQYLFLGAPYSTIRYNRYQINRIELQSNKVKSVETLNLPYDLNLYAFDWVPGKLGNEKDYDLVGLSDSGVLMLFREAGKGYRKVWSSREKYGGSANFVPVEISDPFNHVISEFYSIPIEVRALETPQGPQVLVAKNDSLLKDVIGLPVFNGGYVSRLRLDPLGLSSTWVSKKVDGAVIDYFLSSVSGRLQLVTGIRLRDQGFFEGVRRRESVLLYYDLK